MYIGHLLKIHFENFKFWEEFLVYVKVNTDTQDFLNESF